jgi:hypothetical protein
MVTHQTGFPFSKHFSCSCDAETSRPQENALTGLFLDKKPRHAQPIGGSMRVKSFSPNAPPIRCRMASEQFKKEEHRGAWTNRFPGQRLPMTEAGSKEWRGA